MKQDRLSAVLHSPMLRAAEHTHDNHHNSKQQALRLRGFLLVLLATALAATAFGKGQAPGNLSVTTNFASADTSGTITDIQSDGLGSYFDGVGGVTSFLTTNGYNGQTWGDWQFDALSSTTRKVSISFANPIQPSAGGTAVPNPPFTIKNVIAHVEVKCTQMSNGSGGWNNMYQMTINQTFQCPLITHFYDSNGYEYRIYSGPNWEPETTFAQVTCNSVASAGGCNDWYIEVARLEVAMDDPLAVRRTERARNCDGDLECLVERERAFLDAGRESLALQVLHHQKVNSILASDVIENTDIGVLQSGNGPGLAFETGPQVGVLTQVRRKYF